MTDFARRDLAGLAALSLVGTGASAATPAPVWQKLPTEPYKGKQDDISFIDADHGWYGNGQGKLYRTADGGLSWAKTWDQPGTFIRALGFADEKTGFLGNVGVGAYPNVTDTHPLYRSDDGGTHWTKVDAPGIAAVPGICAIDILKRRAVFQGELKEQRIIHAAGRVGGPAYVLRSLNGGDSWTVSDLAGTAGAIFDVKFFNERVGFLAASTSGDLEQSYGLILRTLDGGTSWHPAYRSSRRFETVWKLSFPTPKIGFASIQNYDDDPKVTRRHIVRTTDGGKSWKEFVLADNKAVREFGIGFVDAKHGWVGTTIGGFETHDGGRHWQPAGFGKAVNKIRILPRAGGGTRVFAIGSEVHRLDLD